ncbi:MAG: hypothetical protein WD767_20085 [Alphaproteobacteria bacterium]
MTRLRTIKTSFTAGEISTRLLGRGDLAAYANGARRLRNVFIHPTGGVTRRSGLLFIDQAAGPGRLVAFEFNSEQVYLLVFTDMRMDAYRDGVAVADAETPWTEAQLAEIVWTQSADTLLVCHPDVPPQKVTRTSETDWTVTPWVFFQEDDAIHQPYHKFSDNAVTLAASATTGTVTLTASADLFDPGHVGQRFRLALKEVEIASVVGATEATAVVKQTLTGTAATKDWDEQAFSPVRGWPVSVAFHQDRMVIGGSRDLPNRLWLSKSADLFNFDLGDGDDDEAIEFAILSDQVNAIRAVFSGRHLQVFTSGAEWMVTGDPLTPTNIQLRRQTRVGSPVDRSIPPRDVDGATLFLSRNGRELREFLFTDVEQAYQSNDLAILANHLLVSPVDQDYDQRERLMHVVMGDGSLGTVTVFRAEQVTAWTLQTTAGAFRSVAVVGDDVYVLVARGNGHFIERFDAELQTDSALRGAAEVPTAEWSGMDHLNGEVVTIVADGIVRADRPVADGAITLDQPAATVQVGLGFMHEIEPLPVVAASPLGPAQGTPVRLIRVTYRLEGTSALRVDTGSGFRDVPFKQLGATGVLDSPIQPYTGDKIVRALGWNRSGTTPLWRIAQDTPLPCTVLSVHTEIKVND